MAEQHHFEVKLVRSAAGRTASQRLTLLGLGLTKTNKVVHLKDTPAIRGMIFKVVHLVSLVRKDGALPPKKRVRASGASAQG